MRRDSLPTGVQCEYALEYVRVTTRRYVELGEGGRDDRQSD
jgi:hypothetical protein